VNLTRSAYRHRPVVLSALVVAMVFGLFSYFSLPAREDPKITVREAVITTLFPGLPAVQVEALITRTIEEAVRRVPEVEEIRSESRQGRSVIHVEVQDSYFELDQIWDEVRSKVEQASADLPQGSHAPVLNDDYGDVAVVTAALTAEDFDMGAMFDVAQSVRDALYTVPASRRIDILGAQQERIFVEIDSARIAALGVAPEVIFASIQQQNTIRPGGMVDTGGRSFVIRPTGNYRSVADVEATLVPVGGGAVVPLADLAQVSRGFIDPPQQKAYFNGRPAIIFAIAMDDGASVLDFAPRVRARLAELEQGLPVGYQLDIVTYQAEQVANAVYGVTKSLLQTLAIVIAVSVLFLGLRTGLIVGSIVPAVILVTLAVMGVFDIALERMSLATLIIALGLLVDNGIVISEDFKRRLEDGASRDDALEAVGRELALPLLSSSLTTILVFLPLMLADHVAGEYTRNISLVILITLSASWLLAMTVTPLLCYRFIPHPADDSGGDSSLSTRLFDVLTGGYRRLLVRLLRLRAVFLLLMLGLLAAALALFAQLPSKFFPASDRAQILVYIDLPAGVTLRETDRQMRAASGIVLDRARFPYLGDHAAYVGFGGPRFVLSLRPVDPAPNVGFMVINVDSAADIQRGIRDLRQAFRESLPGVDARVTDMFLGPSDSSVIEIQIKGPDPDYLFATAGEVERALADIPGAIDIHSDWENRVSQIEVRVDQARARRAGVTSRDIALALQTFFSGRAVTEFREGDDIFPVVVRGRLAQRQDLDRVRSAVVYSGGSGEPVPLLQVADFELVNTFSTIARENLQRTVTVSARNLVTTAEDMVPLINPALDTLREKLPYNHSIEFDGVITESVEGRRALTAKTPLMIGIIALLLVAQFNGFRRPLIVFAIVPLITVGAVAGLMLLRGNMGFMVMLGLFALAGIIINNAIVLLDRIDIERDAGGSDDADAIVEASTRRLRPIIMSTVTTILGLLPLILAQDPLFYAMAAAIAFGLGIGTVLTLGVVPVLYSLLFRIDTSGLSQAR
jgi:multidrug efflux pump subunit AcrB